MPMARGAQKTVLPKGKLTRDLNPHAAFGTPHGAIYQAPILNVTESVIPGAKSTKDYILGAAIKLKDGRIFKGATHHEIWGRLPAKLLDLVDDADGFITATGKFLTRKQAGKAISNKTTFEKSRDLWDATEAVGRSIKGTRGAKVRGGKQ